LLSSLSGGAAAVTPVCVRTSEVVEKQIAGATIAFLGKVVTVEQDAGSPIQRLTYRVLNSWKGAVKVGASIHVTVRVTTVCGGFGCAFPFKVGDETLVLAPPSVPMLGPAFIDGCWIHEGVFVSGVLMMPSLAGGR
jgi:hypothetical protein